VTTAVGQAVDDDRNAGVMAIVLLESVHRVFSEDGFFAAIVRAVRRELDATDRQLMVTVADGEASRAQVERYVLDGRVDAVIFASAHGDDPLPRTLASRGVPVVCSGRPLGRSRLPYVDVDHRTGVEAAVSHLLATGRRRVATVAGPQDMVGGVDRLRAYRSVMRRAGMRPLAAMGDFTRESGAAGMHQLLQVHPTIDAVFAASDLMARGALTALRRAGRRVPDDVAVVGFDDLDQARQADPTLTTVHQPVDTIGRELARQAVRLAGGERVETRIVLPTRLVVRQSG
jgi:DNA-binding LacI/PurR family transcriptional regulator